MVLSKTKPHLSTLIDGENEGNKIDVRHGKSTELVDHWAFLDEIEAPMWADLTLEATSTYQDNNEDWFQISHPFHKCSSRELKFAFTHPGEGCTNSSFGMEGPSSPQLPPSVSGSRGKHYKSREWGQSNHRVKLNNQHPVKNLSSKSSQENAEAGRETKSKLSYGNSKGHAGPNPESVCDSSLTETVIPIYSKSISSSRDSKPSNSVTIKGTENSSTSSITFEGSEQRQQMSSEVSSQIFGHTTGLWSALKISLRKSCVTRQASRAEIKGARKSEGCKSSSGKSSVGSSSNPGYDAKSLTLATRRNKDKTPDSRDVMRASQALKIKVKVPNVYKAPAVQVRDINSDSRWASENASKSVNSKTAKTEVQHLAAHTKVLGTRRGNEQGMLADATKAKDIVGVGQYNRYAGGGKENAMGRIAAGQKSSTGAKTTGRMVQVQKASTSSLSRKSVRRKAVGLKENINDQTEGKKAQNVAQKIYIR